MSQRLLLQMIHGSLDGQTFVVPAGSVFLVGRMPECQLAVPLDPTVSRQHFRIEYHPPKCRLIHISQTSETFVNAQIVTEVSLNPGDEITFGTGNVVRVTLEASFGREMQMSTQTIEVPTPRFFRTKSNSGVSVFTAASEQFGVARILEALSQSRPALAWVDFGKLGQPVPDDLAHSPRLFSWLPPDLAAKISPVLITKDSTVSFADFVAEGWGKNALLCFGCNTDVPAAVSHWRKAVGAVEDAKPPQTLTAYFIPSLARMILQNQTDQLVAPLMSGVSWLLTEALDTPGQWMLFGHDKLEQILTASGWILAAAPPQPTL